MELDGNGFPNIGFSHIGDLAISPFDAEELTIGLVVLGSEFSNSSHYINTAVLSESLGNDFQGIGDGSEGVLSKSLDSRGELVETSGHFHFNSAASGDELRLNEDVFGNSQTVVEVSLHFVEDILAAAAQNNAASLRLLALSHEGKILVSNLLDFEETAALADVFFLKFLGTVNDLGSSDSRNTHVVGFSDSSDHRNIFLHEKVLR